MIRLINVKKAFNRHKANEIRAIDNTSIELPDTGLVTFLGNSGCGKTTLLNAIGGLDKVDKGDIYIDNTRITRRTSNAKDEIRNINIGYIFQNYNLIEDATVFENVAVALRMIGLTEKDAIEKRVMYILERVGIARYRNRPAKMLSGGERQRVGIARAIVKNPRIIIADEPTGNLDSKNTIEVMNIIKAISKEKLVILVTHERKIAEFYADRIVEIVDGKVIDDRENIHDNALDYSMDTRIYLKDMPYAVDLSQKGFDVKLYSDHEETPPPIKIVIRNNNLYIEAGDTLAMGDEGIEIIDDHYKGITQEDFEGYKFDYDSIFGSSKAPRYKSIYGPFKSLISGFKKLGSYSRIKKILLLGFVLASMFVIYAASNVAGVTNITDDQFITTHKDYLTANIGVVTLTSIKNYEGMEGIDYVIPGSGEIKLFMPIDDYLQSTGVGVIVSGILADAGKLGEEDLMYGGLPRTNREIVIDYLTYVQNFENTWDTSAKEVGIDSPEKIIGRTFKLSPYMPEFTVVGISNTVCPCIYVKKSMITTMAINDMGNNITSINEVGKVVPAGSIVAYSHIENDPEKWIVRGEAPVNDFEVLVSDKYIETMWIEQVMDTKVAGNNLVVCGFYHDERGGEGLYVNDNTEFLADLSSKTNLTLAPVDKEETYFKLTGEHLSDAVFGSEDGGGSPIISVIGNINSTAGTSNQYSIEDTEAQTADATAEDSVSGEGASGRGTTRITDPYGEAKTAYERSIREGVFRTVIMAIIIVIISLIEIYLILRASFLSRIKEVGVLRAIGLKKKDIYRMFGGEVVAISLIASLPGMLLMGYILNAISNVSYLSGMYRMSPLIFGMSYGLVFVFNLLAGLLPVFFTLRKTPAAILARNDVN